MIKDQFNLDAPMLDIFPEEWRDQITEYYNVEFRNLDHFKHVVSQLKQKDDKNCDVSYEQALKELIAGKSQIEKKEHAEIQNLVKSNLFKRGLITEEVYEAWKYDTEGTRIDVDVAKYADGQPDCVIVPQREYIDFFYELYVSISYPWSVANAKVRENVVKLLSTIEELERQHVFIKITLVLPTRNSGTNNERKQNMFSTIPLFSHRETKDAFTMSSVLNERLLRKFYFAVLEDLFGKNIAWGYGQPMELHKAMNIGNHFDEVEFFQLVMEEVNS